MTITTDATTYSRVLERMQANITQVWAESSVERDARACVARIRAEYAAYYAASLPRPFAKLDAQLDKGLLVSTDWLCEVFSSNEAGANDYRRTISDENMTAAVAAMNAYALMVATHAACISAIV